MHHPILGCKWTSNVDTISASPDLFSLLKSNTSFASGAMRINRKKRNTQGIASNLKKGDNIATTLPSWTLENISEWSKKKSKFSPAHMQLAW